MTEFRAERCGKLVGLSGHPCMRVPGHQPPCLTGVEPYVDEDIIVGVAVPNFRQPSIRRLFTWKIWVAVGVVWLLAFVQLWWDIYTLVR